MKALLVTSVHRRHAAVAAALARELELVGILTETKPKDATTRPELSDADAKVLSDHFAQRDEVERRLLGEPEFPNVARLDLERGGANKADSLAWARDLAPDYVLLFGSSVLGAPWLEAFPRRVVNLHLGLSPYYRGSGTNFWPLVHGRPECVGATIHLAVEKVDAGAILGQVRPNAHASDGPHELGTNAMLAAVEVLPRLLREFQNGSRVPVEQSYSERAFRRRDLTSEAVLRMRANFEDGMLTAYLAQKSARDVQVPIVSSDPIRQATRSGVAE